MEVIAIQKVRIGRDENGTESTFGIDPNMPLGNMYRFSTKKSGWITGSVPDDGYYQTDIADL